MYTQDLRGEYENEAVREFPEPQVLCPVNGEMEFN